MIMSFTVCVIEDHPTIEGLMCASEEHYFEYEEYPKALAHFKFLVNSNQFDWVELKDEDAELNEHDGLSLCWQR